MAAVSFVISVAACSVKPSKHQEEKGKSSVSASVQQERLKLKNAAFCACLSKSSPEYDSLMIKDGSASGYLETSRYSIDAFAAVFNSATIYAQKEYSSKYNKQLVIMKCLDFYNSKELDDLVVGLDGELALD